MEQKLNKPTPDLGETPDLTEIPDTDEMLDTDETPDQLSDNNIKIGDTLVVTDITDNVYTLEKDGITYTFTMDATNESFTIDESKKKECDCGEKDCPECNGKKSNKKGKKPFFLFKNKKKSNKEKLKEAMELGYSIQ